MPAGPYPAHLNGLLGCLEVPLPSIGFRAETLQSVSTRALCGCIYNPGWDIKGCATTVEYGSGSLISKVNPGFGENMPVCIQNEFTKAFLRLDKDAIAVFIGFDNERVSTSCLRYGSISPVLIKINMFASFGPICLGNKITISQ